MPYKNIEDQRRYRKINAKRLNAKKREKYRNNPDYRASELKYAKNYRDNNKDLINKRNRKKRAENPDEAYKYQRKYRDKRKAALNNVSRETETKEIINKKDTSLTQGNVNRKNNKRKERDNEKDYDIDAPSPKKQKTNKTDKMSKLSDHLITIDTQINSIDSIDELKNETTKKIELNVNNGSTISIAYQLGKQRRQPTRNIYHVRKENDLQKLIKECKLDEYYHSFINVNKEKELDVIIAPVAALVATFGYGYGAFTVKNITASNQFLSHFVGEEESFNENNHSEYLFKVNDELVLDSKKTCNWTRFINHSSCPNLDAIHDYHPQENDLPEESNIFFSPIKDIKEESQLFFDYGNDYFKDHSLTQIFLHETDNWQYPEEKYEGNKALFCKESLIINNSVAACFKLTPTSTHPIHFLATKLFAAIYHGEEKRVSKLSKNNKYLELPSYVLEKTSKDFYSIQSLKQQDNITPIMLACLLGNKHIITNLIDAGADINRCGLHTGHNAGYFTIIGDAKPDTKIELLNILINEGINLLVIDAEDKNLLAHAVMKSEMKVIDFLLNEKKCGVRLLEGLSTDMKENLDEMKAKIVVQEVNQVQELNQEQITPSIPHVHDVRENEYVDVSQPENRMTIVQTPTISQNYLIMRYYDDALSFPSGFDLNTANLDATNLDIYDNLTGIDLFSVSLQELVSNQLNFYEVKKNHHHFFGGSNQLLNQNNTENKFFPDLDDDQEFNNKY